MRHFCHWLEYVKPEPEETKGGGKNRIVGKDREHREHKSIYRLRVNFAIQQLVHGAPGIRDKFRVRALSCDWRMPRPGEGAADHSENGSLDSNTWITRRG